MLSLIIPTSNRKCPDRDSGRNIHGRIYEERQIVVRYEDLSANASLTADFSAAVLLVLVLVFTLGSGTVGSFLERKMLGRQQFVSMNYFALPTSPATDVGQASPPDKNSSS